LHRSQWLLTKLETRFKDILLLLGHLRNANSTLREPFLQIIKKLKVKNFDLEIMAQKATKLKDIEQLTPYDVIHFLLDAADLVP